MAHNQKNKKGKESPIGKIIPDYNTQIYIDEENKKLYVANGLASSDWLEMTGSGEEGGGQ